MIAAVLAGGTFPGMGDSLQLTILYEDGGEGWIMASIPAVPGVISQGRSRSEARENVIDALKLMLSPEPGDDDGRGAERESLKLTLAV